MRRPGRGVAVLVTAGAIGVSGASSPRFGLLLSAGALKTQSAAPPVVRIAVNQHLRRIAEHSTYQFDFSGVLDNSMSVISGPVVVEYVGADGSAFTLPPAGFVALSQSGGWVYDVTIALPGEAKPLAAAYEVAASVDGILARTQWRRSGGPLPTLDQVRRDLGTPQPGSSGAHGLGEWRFGTAELVLTLKRTASGGERTEVPGVRRDADLYVVEAEVYDGAPVDAYEKRTYDIRRARQRGDAEHPLPLTSVLDDPTPVPDMPRSRPRTP